MIVLRAREILLQINYLSSIGANTKDNTSERKKDKIITSQKGKDELPFVNWNT